MLYACGCGWSVHITRSLARSICVRSRKPPPKIGSKFAYCWVSIIRMRLWSPMLPCTRITPVNMLAGQPKKQPQRQYFHLIQFFSFISRMDSSIYSHVFTHHEANKSHKRRSTTRVNPLFIEKWISIAEVKAGQFAVRCACVRWDCVCGCRCCAELWTNYA